MILPINMGEKSYDIIIENDVLLKIGEYLNLDRKVLVLTDSGVPQEYAESVKRASKNAFVYVIEAGESSKSFDNYKNILSFMLENEFTRTDCLVAVGGGVVGDLGGFVAASYMRGIDFYNVPTTLLSQLDSSVGGKVAIDLGDVKNCVGAFYQPKKVIIDSNTLSTLDKRQKMSGLCEAIKMFATMDEDLFSLLENATELDSIIDDVILGGLRIKKYVVENDPYEKNLRKVLNFGHTIGHAIESSVGLGTLLHGECVGIGMIPMADKEASGRIKALLNKYNLPIKCDTPTNILLSYIKKDKKTSGDEITIAYVPKIGSFELRKIKIEEMKTYIEGEVI